MEGRCRFCCINMYMYVKERVDNSESKNDIVEHGPGECEGNSLEMSFSNDVTEYFTNLRCTSLLVCSRNRKYPCSATVQ